MVQMILVAQREARETRKIVGRTIAAVDSLKNKIENIHIPLPWNQQLCSHS